MGRAVDLGLNLRAGPVLNKGGGASPAGPDAAITALNLWAGGAPGMWYDPSDRTTLFQTTDTSTPALADNDPVQRVGDKSGNGKHWLSSSAGTRGVNFAAGTVKGVKLDGVDDGYSVAWSAGSGLSAFFALDRLTDSSFIVAHCSPTNAYFGVALSGAQPSFFGSGAATIRVNGAAIGSTRTDFLSACPQNTPVVVAYENLDLSLWPKFSFGDYGGVVFGGRLIGFMICLNQNAGNRSTIEQWLAAKAGISF